MLELKAIPLEIYVPFVVNHFEKCQKHIDAANVEKVYNLFKGHTYYMQKTFNEAFADTPENAECTVDTIRDAIDDMKVCQKAHLLFFMHKAPTFTSWGFVIT